MRGLMTINNYGTSDIISWRHLSEVLATESHRAPVEVMQQKFDIIIPRAKKRKQSINATNKTISKLQ